MTGFKIFGEIEWKVMQHGYSKRWTWRKLHSGIDESSGEIIAAILTTNDVGDGEIFPELVNQIDGSLVQASVDSAYDSFENYELLHQRGVKITIPPRENAKIWQHGNGQFPPLIRDETIHAIRKLGRTEWKRQSGYHRRSIAETTIFRFKQIFGEHLNYHRYSDDWELILGEKSLLFNDNDVLMASFFTENFDTSYSQSYFT